MLYDFLLSTAKLIIFFQLNGLCCGLMTQQMHFCVLHIALRMYGVRPAAVGVWLTANILYPD